LDVFAPCLQRGDFGGIAAAVSLTPRSSFVPVVTGCRMALAAFSAVSLFRSQVQDY
jgi:hypothetical protein